ncbi:GNAT family N-acetyltransferase [Brooklawnia sp.]|uniref:GNAT family N-acetyltransferase n=1 Tax=Brooklawnia sp. TaxID=2699740 RepID=UPI00311F93B8
MSKEWHPDSVRLAMPAEAIDIVAVQRAWLASEPRLAPMLDELDADEMAQAWVAAIVRPPLATYRVLVAIDQAGEIVGFAAVGPSEDPDTEPSDALVAEFCVHPSALGAGHEDRLMHAVADTLRTDGFERATWWVTADDDTTRELLNASGWAPDGAHQEVGNEDGDLRIKQVRLHTSLI